MRNGPLIRRFALLALCLLLLAACVRSKTPAETTSLPGSLGVAAFTQATLGRELLGGSIPEWAGPVDPKLLIALDEALHNEVVAKRGRTFTESPVVRRCQEIEDSGSTGSERTPLDYWLAVGRCAGVDFLLVPQLTALRTKDIGKEQPAAVAYELSLVDVSGRRLLKRFHFEEAQQFLTDDILKLGTYIKRGGKWITAVDLATEGFRRAAQELWL